MNFYLLGICCICDVMTETFLVNSPQYLFMTDILKEKLEANAKCNWPNSNEMPAKRQNKNNYILNWGKQ